MNQDTLNFLALQKDVQNQVLRYIPLAVLKASKDHQNFSDIDPGNWDRAAFGLSFVRSVALQKDFFVKTDGVYLAKMVARIVV